MDQFYYESGYIVDGYFAYIAEAMSEINATTSLSTVPRTTKNNNAVMAGDSSLIVTIGLTSRPTIIPTTYSSTANLPQYGALYIDQGPEVLV